MKFRSFCILTMMLLGVLCCYADNTNIMVTNADDPEDSSPFCVGDTLDYDGNSGNEVWKHKGPTGGVMDGTPPNVNIAGTYMVWLNEDSDAKPNDGMSDATSFVVAEVENVAAVSSGGELVLVEELTTCIGETVTLSARLNPDILHGVTWTITSQPTGSSLQGSSGFQTHIFTPTVLGTYVVRATCGSSYDEITVIVVEEDSVEVESVEVGSGSDKITSTTNSPGTSETYYVHKGNTGDTITITANPNPSGSWPFGKPTWTGATAGSTDGTATFDIGTVSASSTGTLVTATCGSSSKSLYIVVWDLEMTENTNVPNIISPNICLNAQGVCRRVRYDATILPSGLTATFSDTSTSTGGSLECRTIADGANTVNITNTINDGDKVFVYGITTGSYSFKVVHEKDDSQNPVDAHTGSGEIFEFLDSLTGSAPAGQTATLGIALTEGSDAKKEKKKVTLVELAITVSNTSAFSGKVDVDFQVDYGTSVNPLPYKLRLERTNTAVALSFAGFSISHSSGFSLSVPGTSDGAAAAVNSFLKVRPIGNEPADEASGVERSLASWQASSLRVIEETEQDTSEGIDSTLTATRTIDFSVNPVKKIEIEAAILVGVKVANNGYRHKATAEAGNNGSVETRNISYTIQDPNANP